MVAVEKYFPDSPVSNPEEGLNNTRHIAIDLDAEGEIDIAGFDSKILLAIGYYSAFHDRFPPEIKYVALSTTTAKGQTHEKVFFFLKSNSHDAFLEFLKSQYPGSVLKDAGFFTFFSEDGAVLNRRLGGFSGSLRGVLSPKDVRSYRETVLGPKLGPNFQVG